MYPLTTEAPGVIKILMNIPSDPNLLFKFLSDQFDSSAFQGSLNTTRFALSLFIGPKLGQDDRIKQFMRGVFRTKPRNLKYYSTWDPSPVLKQLSAYYPNTDNIILDQTDFLKNL